MCKPTAAIQRRSTASSPTDDPADRAGLAFYEQHREEIDEDQERRLAEVERLRREIPEAPIVEKIRQLREGKG